MSQPARLDERVTQLESEMAEVRFLATKAESEVSDMQTVFRGHTGVLNAIRQDQVKQGMELASVKAEVKNVRAEMHTGFAQVDEEFADVRSEMRKGFGELARGQELITNLLTRHLGEPDEETRAGDAGE
jgi:hypothetical protein